jgi:hypothetical protein
LLSYRSGIVIVRPLVVIAAPSGCHSDRSEKSARNQAAFSLQYQ